MYELNWTTRYEEAVKHLDTIKNPFIKEAFDRLNVAFNGCKSPEICHESPNDEEVDFMVSCQCGKSYQDTCFETLVFKTGDFEGSEQDRILYVFNVCAENFRKYFCRFYAAGMDKDAAVEAATLEVALTRSSF